MSWQGEIIKVDRNRYRIPKTYKHGMRTDGVIFASEELFSSICDDRAPEQVVNVAMLPGIVGYSMAMPDIHWGYGFPIGGVAAFSMDEGIISPGGVGYDINCGVRLLRTCLMSDAIRSSIKDLVHALFNNIPSGIGSKGKIRIHDRDVKEVLHNGAAWAIQHGYGWNEDLAHTEEQGCLAGADPSLISKRALERGRPQLGTLGAGNHFLEIQTVTDIYDTPAAQCMGIDQVGQVMIMIHTGSRGLGYQVCDDNVRYLRKAVTKYGIDIPEGQLACAPVSSPEGRAYFAQMACAANYAWANRQCIMHWVREAFERILNMSAEKLGMHLVYDVAHNIAKFETHRISGNPVKVCVHRKGATRAFPPQHQEIPDFYKTIGQPVIIPGDMGTHSYVLVGTDRAMEETFGSTCHGAGRVLSRKSAKQRTKGRCIEKELLEKGIYVLAASEGVLHEEVPEAYKDIDRVVDAVHEAGISRKVARMRPLGVVKG
jgi:tRNA-splicing ligase RtcB